MWKRSSLSSSCSTVARRKRERRRMRKSLSMDTLLNGSEDLCNGCRQGFPGVLLDRELLASALGQLVVLGAAIVVGSTPARFDPAAALEPVKRGGEKAQLSLCAGVARRAARSP